MTVFGFVLSVLGFWVVDDGDQLDGIIMGRGMIACSLPSVGDHCNIILEILRSKHKERGKFKDNMIKQQLG